MGTLGKWSKSVMRGNNVDKGLVRRAVLVFIATKIMLHFLCVKIEALYFFLLLSATKINKWEGKTGKLREHQVKTRWIIPNYPKAVKMQTKSR